jgi:hypothetical protein
MTQRRKVATNEVVNATRRPCLPEVFQTFYADYHSGVGLIAKLAMPNLDRLGDSLLVLMSTRRDSRNQREYGPWTAW